MNSLKPFDIRLTDIWIECQKEMIEMRDKVIDLKSCLRTSEQINKHLIKCNEILVAIIEKCKIQENNNKGMNLLIKTIKTEEECIETEKQNLKKFKDQLKSDFNEHKVFELISGWNQNSLNKTSTEDKSIQTSNDENSLVFVTENVEKVIDLSETDVNFDVKNESIFDSNTQNFNSNNWDQNDNRSDISVKSDGFDISDDSEDTDSEPQKPKRKVKTLLETTPRTQRLNSVVMPFKVGDKYVCTQPNCQFSSGAKRVFYTHINKHRKGSLYESEEPLLKECRPISERQREITETCLPFKVNDHYVCTKELCHFKTRAVRDFYRHWRRHDTTPRKRRFPTESKSNDSERPYVCDWPACTLAFKRPQHLSLHRKRHMGERDFVCDWPGCGATMYTSHNYHTHRLTHTDERPWKCEWPGCVYSCKQKWALVAHRRIHTGEKPYLCPFPECGYRCSQPCTMLSHKRKHTGEKPYHCVEKGCDKSFSSLAGIWTHKKMHQKKDSIELPTTHTNITQKVTKRERKGKKGDPDRNDCQYLFITNEETKESTSD